MSDRVELFIYDEIGPDYWGLVSAKRVLTALADAKDKPVLVRINSPGGDVFEGQSIYNALLRHGPGVDVAIDSLAASAASFIAMAGKTIEIAENAMVMIHRVWTIAMGNAEQLAKQVEVLKTLDTTIAATYAARTGRDAQEIADMMEAETWMTAQEAIDKGFADAIGQKLNVKACVGRLSNVPERLLVADVSQPTRQHSIYSPDHVRRVVDLRRRKLDV